MVRGALPGRALQRVHGTLGHEAGALADEPSYTVSALTLGQSRRGMMSETSLVGMCHDDKQPYGLRFKVQGLRFGGFKV